MQLHRVTVSVLVWAGLIGGGCRASVQADANASVRGGGSDDESAYLNEPIESSERGEGTEPAALQGGPPAMLGARHDLTLSPNVKTTTCQCLAVALGQPNDPKMVWQGGVPSIDPQSQLVISLSSAGTSCAGEPADSQGASYWGYRERGDDIVVVVEAARQGRPVTTGAIIPKPFGSGQVYIEPSSPGLVYGKSLTGSGPCKIGNPGAPRTTRSSAPPETQTMPEVIFSD